MAIVFQCEDCGARYRVRDDRAEKRVKCKKCGTILQIPPVDDPPRSGDGTRLYRHEARARDFEPAFGNELHIEAIGDHIEKHIGPVESVFHELISDLVHIDIHWVKPTPDRPCHVLVTSGMSDRPMTVPDECDDMRHAELMLYLPPDWKIDQEDFDDERWYWPIRLMKVLARLPHEYETWLGPGHTVPNGDPAEPYADGTELAGAVILPAIGAPDEFDELPLDDGTVIHFYCIVPLYDDEMNFKLANGLDALLDRLEENEVSEVIDPGRTKTCRPRRKKRFGWF